MIIYKENNFKTIIPPLYLQSPLFSLIKQ